MTSGFGRCASGRGRGLDFGAAEGRRSPQRPA
jgi:hypothetical protein